MYHLKQFDAWPSAHAAGREQQLRLTPEGHLTGGSAGVRPNRSNRPRYGNSRTTCSNNSRTDNWSHNDPSSNRFQA